MLSSFLQPEQPIPGTSAEVNTIELRRCPIHTAYNVEVYCPKENLQPSVMCIKCYLDPEVSKHFRGEPLIAIRDLILKSMQIDNSQGPLFLESKAEILERKYYELNSWNHTAEFKRHSEIQMRKLDAELDRVKQSLDELRGKFVKFFEKQAQMLENRHGEIEKKIYHFLLEKEEIEKKSFGSLEELLGELNGIEEFKEYEKFVRLLYKKTQFEEEGREGTSLKKIVDLIDDKGTLLLNMKHMKIDTGILEEIRDKIDSIDILDKATNIPGVSTLDHQLEKTLDKIRRAENKTTPSKLTPSKIAEVKETSKNPSPYKEKEKEKEKESPSFSKLLEALREKKSATPSPYKGKVTPNTKIQMDLRQRSSDLFKEKNGYSPYKGGENQKNSMEIEYSKKKEDGEALFGEEGHREERGTPAFARTRSLLENLKEKYDPQDEGQENNKAPIQKQKTAEKVNTSALYTPLIFEAGFTETLKAKKDSGAKLVTQRSTEWHATEIFPTETFPAEQSKDPMSLENILSDDESEPEVPKDKGAESEAQNIPATLIIETTITFDPNRKDGINLATPPIEFEEERQRDDRPEDSKISKREEILIDSESSSEEDKKKESRSPSIQESSRENIVQQWIDQKLSGFAVFQNTLRSQDVGAKEEDFNRHSSQNWIQLKKSEKDEYTTFAMSKRQQLREEFKELCQDIEDLSELQELLDQRIKKVKK